MDNYNTFAVKRIDVKDQMYKAFNSVKKHPHLTCVATGGVTFIFNEDDEECIYQVDILVTSTFKKLLYAVVSV